MLAAYQRDRGAAAVAPGVEVARRPSVSRGSIQQPEGERFEIRRAGAGLGGADGRSASGSGASIARLLAREFTRGAALVAWAFECRGEPREERVCVRRRDEARLRRVERPARPSVAVDKDVEAQQLEEAVPVGLVLREHHDVRVAAPLRRLLEELVVGQAWQSVELMFTFVCRSSFVRICAIFYYT